jgi:hypothetical protein
VGSAGVDVAGAGAACVVFCGALCKHVSIVNCICHLSLL